MMNKITEDEFEKYLRATAQNQSNYALKNFVDGGQITDARNFRQCVIEYNASLNTYKNLKNSVEMENLKKMRLEIRKSKYLKNRFFFFPPDQENVIRAQECFLKIQNCDRTIKELEIGIQGVLRELKAHEENLKEYKTRCGIKDTDSERDIYDKLQKAESEYFIKKLALDMLAHRFSIQQGVTTGVVLALSQMPEADRLAAQEALQIEPSTTLPSNKMIMLKK